MRHRPVNSADQRNPSAQASYSPRHQWVGGLGALMRTAWLLLFVTSASDMTSKATAAVQRKVALISGEVHTTRDSPLTHSGQNGWMHRRLMSSGTADDIPHVWLVGFPPEHESHVHAMLHAHGGECLHPLPGRDHHWLITGSANAVNEVLQAHPDATAALMPVEVKMSPALQAAVGGEGFEWRQAKASGKSMALEALMPGSSAQQLAQAAQAAATDLPHALPTKCELQPRVGSHMLRLVVCAEGIPMAAAWLAAQPRVTWVTLHRPPQLHNLFATATLQAPSLMNVTVPPNSAQNGTSSGLFPLWATGINGTGQVVGVVDGGLDVDSCYFYDPNASLDNITTTRLDSIGPSLAIDVNGDGKQDYYTDDLLNVTYAQNLDHRKVIQYVYWADDMTDDHGTHTSGTVAGSVYDADPLTHPTLATGVAPGAKIAFFDVGLGKSETLEAFPQMDPAMLFEIQRKVGARISSNSYGSPDYGYGVQCYMYDAWARATPDTLLVYATGNDGALLANITTTGTVASPGNCKNVLTVGATEGWVQPSTFTQEKVVNLAQDGEPVRRNTSEWLPVEDVLFKNHEPRKYRLVAGGNGSEVATLLNFKLYHGQTLPLGRWSYIPFSSTDSDDDFLLALVQTGKQPTPPHNYTQYDSSLGGLVSDNVTSVPVVLSYPPDACGPLMVRPFTQPTLVLVRKSFQNSDCSGSDSLQNVYNSGAAGVIMWWADALGPVQTGSSAFAGKAYPAISISPELGLEIAALLLNETEVALRWDAVNPSPIPIENVAYFSAYSPYRPTLDGEDFLAYYKPDVVAPGYLLSAATDGKTSGTVDECASHFLQGTSMATPVVSGAAVLTRQYFVDGFYPTGAKDPGNSFEPSATLLKAVIVAGAAAMTGISRIDGRPLEPPPSTFQGFGRVDLSASLPLADDSRGWALQVVDGAVFETDNVEHVYNVTVPEDASGKPLIVTLAWLDWPAFPGAITYVVNNLDLRVNRSDTAGGQEWWGNGVPGALENSVERVYIAQPAAGNYKISVRAAYLFSGARPQTYSLVVLGGIKGTLPGAFNPANGSTSPLGTK